jgi:hypothetical protein
MEHFEVISDKANTSDTCDLHSRVAEDSYLMAGNSVLQYLSIIKYVFQLDKLLNLHKTNVFNNCCLNFSGLYFSNRLNIKLAFVTGFICFKFFYRFKAKSRDFRWKPSGVN